MRTAKADSKPLADQDIPVTTASEWRRQSRDGLKYRLPGSGNVAKLKRVSLLALATGAGGIPNTLSADVMRLLRADERPDELSEEQKVAAFQANAKAFIEVAALVMNSPRLVLGRTPTEAADEIGPEDMADFDFAWIYFSFLEGDANSIARFRVD